MPPNSLANKDGHKKPIRLLQIQKIALVVSMPRAYGTPQRNGLRRLEKKYRKQKLKSGAGLITNKELILLPNPDILIYETG
jgi:hypothetical protein